jgi:TatD DNase family protein
VIDTHCHLDQPVFDADRAAVLARALAAGVTDILVPAIGPERWEGLLAMAASTPGVHVGLGIHPQLLPELDPRRDDRLLADLEATLERGGARFVGECGLDGGSVAAGASLERQEALLLGQLRLAARLRLPVSLHGLRAHEPLLRLLEREGLPHGGVFHSYSAPVAQVGAFARAGAWFAFAGPVTYAGARRPLEAARAVPRDRLLLETDAPDQTPRPHHGRCEPAQLVEVAGALAAALGLPVAELDQLTTGNARRLFGLPARA